MFKILPASTWELKLSDEARISLLLNPATPESIIDDVVSDVKTSLIHSKIIECNDRPGFHRHEAKFPIKKELYDIFFNGCAGYRAQYYHSISGGNAYNDFCIRKIIPLIMKHEVKHPRLSEIGNSLLQYDSKVTWDKGDWGNYEAPDILPPPHWKKYWGNRPGEVSSGLKDFCDFKKCLWIKGSFVSSSNEVHVVKPDRAEKLHKSGWS